MKDWTNKWISRNEISKEWAKYIVNVNAVPGKNSTLYKTHKPNNPVRLLTTGCNTAIEHLSRFIEVVCAPLTNNNETRVRDTSHLFDIIDELNPERIPDNTILVSFDTMNMYPSIDNDKGITAVRNALETRAYIQAGSRHHLPSILGKQKRVVLRLGRICSTDEEFNNNSKEYKADLIGRGNKLNNVEKSFNDALNMSRQQSLIKETNSTNSKNKVLFVVSIIHCDRTSRALFKNMRIFLTIVK